MIRALCCDTHYMSIFQQALKPHSNQYPNPKQYPKPYPNPNTITYALIKCCRNIVQSQYSARTLKTLSLQRRRERYMIMQYAYVENPAWSDIQ